MGNQHNKIIYKRSQSKINLVNLITDQIKIKFSQIKIIYKRKDINNNAVMKMMIKIFQIL